jgi:hypothetical protein
VRSPPESIRDISEELYSYLNDLWEFAYSSVPYVKKKSIADDGFIDLPNAVQGFGTVLIGDIQEWVMFTNVAAGTVTVLTDSASNTLNSTNVATADTDTNLCIIDNGTNVRVKNRLGSALETLIIYWYYP